MALPASENQYCYISTTTSKSSDPYNYQNIPYRMETTTPVIYQGSNTDPLCYMPIAIWSNIPVFSNTVYYNTNGSTVTYPDTYILVQSMNMQYGPAM